jgi:hypothetical protein
MYANGTVASIDGSEEPDPLGAFEEEAGVEVARGDAYRPIGYRCRSCGNVLAGGSYHEEEDD